MNKSFTVQPNNQALCSNARRFFHVRNTLMT
nr:MAG TPA: hypothetical protein [Caudoviricetes sp.]